MDSQNQSMRTFLMVLFFSLSFFCPANARLGETRGQIEKRYGKPLRQFEEDGVTGLLFEKGNFTILCCIRSGAATIVQYVKNTGISQNEVEDLLNKNSAAQGFKIITLGLKYTKYSEAISKRYAVYRPLGKTLTFMTEEEMSREHAFDKDYNLTEGFK